MPSADFTVREADGVTVVRLTIDNLLSVAEVSRVGNDLNKLVDSGASKLIVDLKQIIYAGSATLGMLLSLREKIGGKKGKMVLASIDSIEKLFSLSRTKSLFEIAPNANDAMILFKKV